MEIKLKSENTRVGISPNLEKESVRVDANGNEIDPKTGEVITKADNSDQ